MKSPLIYTPHYIAHFHQCKRTPSISRTVAWRRGRRQQEHLNVIFQSKPFTNSMISSHDWMASRASSSSTVSWGRENPLAPIPQLVVQKSRFRQTGFPEGYIVLSRACTRLVLSISRLPFHCCSNNTIPSFMTCKTSEFCSSTKRSNSLSVWTSVNRLDTWNRENYAT